MLTVFCESDLEGDVGETDLYRKLGKDLRSCLSSVKYKDKSSKLGTYLFSGSICVLNLTAYVAFA